MGIIEALLGMHGGLGRRSAGYRAPLDLFRLHDKQSLVARHRKMRPHVTSLLQVSSCFRYGHKVEPIAIVGKGRRNEPGCE